MLTLAAYRLESPSESNSELDTLWTTIGRTVDAWLSEKGIDNPAAEAGSFNSKTPGAIGSFENSTITSASGTLREISLTEPTKDGHTFETNLAVTNTGGSVVVYLTLAASNAGDMVAPTAFYPRCPALIHELLSLETHWSFGGSEIPPAAHLSLAGEKSAEKLVGYLTNPERSLPVTVISELDGEPIWDELPEKLANDLAGLSSVVRIDGDASWALNDLLGKTKSCYLGAVRIYWPLKRGSSEAAELRSNVWTAERLLSNDADGKGLSRFTTSLRRQVMSVAALSVDAPHDIRRLKSEHSRARLAKLEAKADANSEELELAKLFIEENETLKDELEAAKAEIAKQSARADAAEYAIEVLKRNEDADSEAEDQTSESPVAGEVRYYKKYS